jgi:DedD protein
MGLFSFFSRSPATAPARASTAEAVDAARTRARRRLIGAVFLLGFGVIAFPLLFETQPRPIPVDIPIEIPRKDAVPPLVVPAARPTTAAPSQPAASLPVITESKADAGTEVPVRVEAPATPAAKAAPVSKAVAPSPASVPTPTPTPTTTTAAMVPKPDAQPAAEAPGRFVVQVGAYADPSVAREARAKVEKLGLRTYTQTVDTDNGKRIRVRLGPFSARDEAEKAAATVKAGGLPAAVLAL